MVAFARCAKFVPVLWTDRPFLWQFRIVTLLALMTSVAVALGLPDIAPKSCGIIRTAVVLFGPALTWLYCTRRVQGVWPSLLFGAIGLTAIASLLDIPYFATSAVLASIARSFVLIFGQFSAFVTLRLCIAVGHRMDALAADAAAEQEKEEASADRPGADADGP